MHILFIEDSTILTRLFESLLQILGEHTLTIAFNKAEAMTAFQKETFDLIFIDMGLEGDQAMGLEILTEMKALKPKQRIGILSSNDLRELVRRSREGGAEFYMVKPFTLGGLTMVMKGDKEAIDNYVLEISEGRIIAF